MLRTLAHELAVAARLDDARDPYADYTCILGSAAREVVSVWLVAISLQQHGQGRCDYASIRVETNEGTLEVL